VDEHLGGVHARLMGDRLARVLARAGELEGLGAVKCQHDTFSMCVECIPVEAGVLPDRALLVRIRLSSR
jgi:hypothetical protein